MTQKIILIKNGYDELCKKKKFSKFFDKKKRKEKSWGKNQDGTPAKV
jgi:hypothetical protein